MPEQNKSLAEELRSAAEQLRKVAGTLPEPLPAVELDPEKVRDFLVFYGGMHAY
jgi:hypothetical protein